MKSKIQQRLDKLSEYLEELSSEDYSFNKIISLELSTVNVQNEIWDAVINTSGYETLLTQFCENSKYTVKYDLDGNVLDITYVRSESEG